MSLLNLAESNLGISQPHIREVVQYLICSDDEYAVNVATVGILEGLKSMGNDELVSKTLGSRSLEVFRNLNY